MNEQAIFLAALDIADPVQRAEYVNRACDGDLALRTQVEALLAAHERSGEFLDVPALKQMTPADPPAETYAESLPSLGRDRPFLPGASDGSRLARAAGALRGPGGHWPWRVCRHHLLSLLGRDTSYIRYVVTSRG